MAMIKGLTALESVKRFRARNWYSKEFPKLALRLEADYSKRCEVAKGGKVTDGTGSSATLTKLSCTNTYYLISGKMFPVSSSSSSITDVSAKDIANSAGDQAELKFEWGASNGSVPSASTGTASGGTYTDLYLVPELHIESGGVTYTQRVYNSAAQNQGHDSAWSGDLQFDTTAAVNTLEAQADLVVAALLAKFGSSYTVAKSANTSGYFITITAPVGHGYDFTYKEAYDEEIEEWTASANGTNLVANIAQNTNTDAVVEFGGIIFTNGTSASGLDTTSAAAYMAIVATDSDANGGALSEGSYGQLLAVVSGTSTSALGSSYPSTENIHDALQASSSNVKGYNHSGATGFVHLAQVSNTNGTLAIVSNINNHKDA